MKVQVPSLTLRDQSDGKSRIHLEMESDLPRPPVVQHRTLVCPDVTQYEGR